MAMIHPMHRRTSNGTPGELPQDTAYEYRRVIGDYVRRARQDAGMTQRELAEELGGYENTNISAIEVGRTSLPPEHYVPLAEILKIPTKEFAEFLLRWTNPWLYLMLINPKDADLMEELIKVSARKGGSAAEPKKGTKRR